MKALLIIAVAALGVFFAILLSVIPMYGPDQPLPIAVNEALAACCCVAALAGTVAAIIAIARSSLGRK